MDWHRAGVKADAHTKMRKEVAAIVAKYENVVWEELLPSHTIPATVDVFPNGTTKIVPAVPLTRTWCRPEGDDVWAWMSSRCDRDEEADG